MDRDFRQELDALDDEATPLALPDLFGLRERSETTDALEQSGVFDLLGTRQKVEKRDADESAREASAAGVFGSWDTLDEKGRTDWMAGERAAAKSSESFWSSLNDSVITPNKGRFDTSAPSYLPGGPTFSGLVRGTFGFAERKVSEGLARAQRRQFLVDQMEAGEREAVKYGTTRNVTEQFSRGLGEGVGSMIAGGGRLASLAAKPSAPEKAIQSTLREKGLALAGGALKSFGDWVSAKAREYFPTDEARQEEFSSALAQGAGSMVAFIGPSLAASLMVRAGPKTLAAMVEDPALAAVVKARARAAGISTAAGLGATMEAEMMAQDAEDARGRGAKLTDDDITKIFLMGLPIGATEALPIGNLFATAEGQIVRAALREAFEEGGQEFGQSVAENIIAQQYYDPDRRWDEGAWEAGLIGSILGASIHGSRETYAKLRGTSRPDVMPIPAAPTAGDTSPPTTQDRQDEKAPEGARVIDLNQFSPVPLQKAPERVQTPVESPAPVGAVSVPEASSAAPRPTSSQGGAVLPDIAASEVPKRDKGGPSGAPAAPSGLDQTTVAPAVDDGSVTTAGEPVDLSEQLGELDKAQLSAVARELGLRVTSKSSAKGLRTAIERTVEEKVYSAEAQDIARRANPVGGPSGDVDLEAEPRAGAAQTQTIRDAIGRVVGPKLTETVAETEAASDLQARFLSTIASGKPRKSWASELGVSVSDLKPLIDQAVKDGYLRVDRNGVVRKTSKVRELVQSPVEGVADGGSVIKEVARVAGEEAAGVAATPAETIARVAQRLEARVPDALKPVVGQVVSALPSFDDIRSRLPTDSNGDPDVAGFVSGLVERFGTGVWDRLSDEQKAEVARELGVEIPQQTVDRTNISQVQTGRVKHLSPLSIPSDLRIDRAVRAREDQTGKPVASITTEYAFKLEQSKEDAKAVAAIIEEIRSDKLMKKGDVHDLAHLVGKPVSKWVTKKDALDAVGQRFNRISALSALNPLAARAGVEDTARRAVELSLRLGNSIQVDEDVVNQVHEEIAPVAKTLPKSTRMGVLVKLEPVRARDRIAPEFDTRGTLRKADGSLFAVDLPLDNFVGDRGFYIPGSDTVGVIHFTGGENIGPTLRGGLAHEAVHALRRTQVFDPAVFDRLLRHAHELQVLDLPLWRFMRSIGEPDWEKSPPRVTLLQAYLAKYANHANFQEAINEEAVAHLVELYYHNQLLPNEYEAVRDILDDLLSGKIAREGRGRTTGEDETPVGALRPIVPEGIQEILDGNRSSGGIGIPIKEKGTLVLDAPLSAIRAFHGSPYDFDKFDSAKIGTGEGAQAYGHGLYFAESEGVAKSYRDTLAESKVGGKPFDENDWQHWASAELHYANGDPKAAIAKLRADYAKHKEYNGGHAQKLLRAAGALERGETIPPFDASGRLYEVSIKADPDSFLDWDKPLSEQSEGAQSALNPIIDRELKRINQMNAETRQALSLKGSSSAARRMADITKDDITLFDVLNGYGAKQDAANALREAGIPGIRYLDQGSRGKGTSLARGDAVTINENDWGRRLTSSNQHVPNGTPIASRTQFDERFTVPTGQSAGEWAHKAVTIGGEPVAVARLSRSGNEITIERIDTLPGARRRGYATQLVDDLLAEFPNAKVRTTMQTDKGRDLFKNFDRAEDGSLISKSRGTYNYVVFPGNEHLIEIIGKDGKPVKGPELDDIIGKMRASSEGVQESSNPVDRTLNLARRMNQTEGESSAGGGAVIRIEEIGLESPHPGPVVAYHGTGTSVDHLDPSKSVDLGLHFGSSKQASKMIEIKNAAGLTADHGGAVHPAVLDVKNVFDGNDAQFLVPRILIRDLQDKAAVSPSVVAEVDRLSNAGKKKEAYDIIRRAFTDAVYDAYRYRNRVEGSGWSYIVWDKNKIKAFGGTTEAVGGGSNKPPSPPGGGQGGPPLAAISSRTGPFRPVDMGDPGRAELSGPEQSLLDLVTSLTKALGLEGLVRLGRLDPGLKMSAAQRGNQVAGQFSGVTGVARLALANDLATLAHEGGHALEVRPSVRDDLDTLKTTHAAEIAQPGAGPKDLSEGFAEWFRIYVTNPQQAKTVAPGFFADFEDMLETAEPAMLEELQDIQSAVEDLARISPAGVVRSRVQSTVKPGRLGALREDIADKGVSQTISEKLYSFYHAFFDARHPMKRAVKFLIETATANLDPQLSGKQRVVIKAIDDPYKLWRLAEHSRVHATAALQNGVVNKRAGDIDPKGPSLVDALNGAFGGTKRAQWTDENLELFGSYLVARRMLAEFGRFDRGELKQAPDQVVSRDVWNQAFAQLEKAFPNFRSGAQILDQFALNMLKLKLDNGFITQELYAELIQRQGYAPLNRIMDDGSPSTLMNAKGQNKRRLIYKFQGSTRDFINPIESMVQDVYATQARIALNDVIRAMDRLARAAGPGGGAIAERIPAKDLKGTSFDIREALKSAARAQGLSQSDRDGLLDIIDDLFDQDAAATIFKATDTNERGEPIVYLWEGGKKVPIRLGDNRIAKDIFDGMAAFGHDNFDIFTNVLALGAQALRFGVTKDPGYIITNFLRDQISTWILSESFTPLVTGAKGARSIAKNDSIAKRYSAFAGLMGGIDSSLVEESAYKRNALMLRRRGFLAAPTTWGSGLRIMEVSEGASRLGHFDAAYKRARKDGLSEVEAAYEAAYAAHDVMDFSRRGAKIVSITRIVAFLNASLQALDAARRTISGDRDSPTGYKQLVTPYLKAATGSPLSIAEKKDLPNSARFWVKITLVGVGIAAIAALYRDDPEYEEFDEYMKATHVMFKDWTGKWRRVPKPFELATPGNLIESVFDFIWKRDEKAFAHFVQGLKHTVIPPHEANVLNVYYEWATGVDLFRERPIVSMDLKKLPPEMQFNAYTSELGKMVGNVTGMSPASVDALMAGLFGSLGRAALTGSDYALPRVNQLVDGGWLPGVSTELRAEKSQEDLWVISRFSRRASRGSLSSKQFWDEMSQDGGAFVAAAEGYKTLKRAGQVRQARDVIDALPEEEKAYAILEGDFTEEEQDLHPLNRARQVMSAASGIRKEMVLGRLFKQGSVPDPENKYREPEPIIVPPSVQKIVNETLEDLSMREARNALVVIGEPGWKQKSIYRTDGLLKELEAASPEVAEEFQARLKNGRNTVYAFEAVRELWPEARERLLKDGSDALLGDLRAEAEAASH